MLFFLSGTYRPGSQQVNQEVSTEACGEHLRDDVEVGHQRRLQDDGNIGGVEKLDGIGVVLATVTCRLDGKVHSEALRFRTIHTDKSLLARHSDAFSRSWVRLTHLEVYDHGEDEDGGNEVHEVGKVLPVEGLSQRTHFIGPSGQQVKQCDDGTLKLGA